MTVKEYREKYQKDNIPDSMLSEEQKAAIKRLTTGTQVSFIRKLPKKTEEKSHDATE